MTEQTSHTTVAATPANGERPAVEGLDGEPRRGGLAVWAPSVMPDLGVELSDEQALACAFRILAGEGFSENMAGPHHLAAPRADRHAGQPVGPVVGRGVGLRRLRGRRRRQRRRRPVGRHAGDPHPHRAAPPPARRPGRDPQPPVLRQPCWRRWACCPRSGAPDRVACSSTTSAASTSTPARSTAAELGADLADADRRRQRRRSCASHGVIVTGATIARGDLPGGHRSTGCAGWPTT